MSSVYEYRVYCANDGGFQTVWAKTPPTVCPMNASHTIDQTQTTIIDESKTNLIQIKEENIPTGGKFQITTLVIDAPKNQITTSTISWPINITLLCCDVNTDNIHTGDVVNACVGGFDTITGNITANVGPASAWTSQNYTTSQSVIYNNKTYTCILNTTSNQAPTNPTYWTRGILINVSQSVIDHTMKGFYMNLYDGTHSNDVGRVLSIASNKIYVELNPTDSFLASSPTYIRQTIYALKDLTFGLATQYKLGENKIGGMAIPPDTEIAIKYDNKSIDTDKKLYGKFELLY